MGFVHRLIESHIAVLFGFFDHRRDEPLFHFPHFFVIVAQAGPAGGRRVGANSRLKGQVVLVDIEILGELLHCPGRRSVEVEQKAHIQIVLFGQGQKIFNIAVVDFAFPALDGVPNQPCPDGVEPQFLHGGHILFPLVFLRGRAS